MSSNLKEKSREYFWQFISQPNKILWLIATALAALLAVANAFPWFNLQCFLPSNSETEKCQQQRSELNTGLILLLLTILSLSNLIERYDIFAGMRENLDKLEKMITEASLRENLDKLEKMITEASFKQQITLVRGSKEWYETAYRIIASAKSKGYIYDASLSSPTWNINKDNPEKKKFSAIREEAFQDKRKDTRYLFTIKSYLEKEKFEKYLEELRKDEKREYDLQIYRDKLQLDKERLETVSGRLEKANMYPNHSAAYLPEIKLQHPILSFLVVDGEKVLLGFYRSEFQESEVNKDRALLIENEEIAALFTEYFRFLWDRASVELAHDSGKTGQLKIILKQLDKQLQQLNHLYQDKSTRFFTF